MSELENSQSQTLPPAKTDAIEEYPVTAVPANTTSPPTPAATASTAPSGTAQVIYQSEVRVHSGPIPDSETLAGYERVVPGTAAEIVQMAVREQRHRHAVNTLKVVSEVISTI